MPKYLVVKGHCGFGNRLQALVGAKVYAEATGRKLIVDWSDGMYWDDGKNVFPELFSLKGAEYSLDPVLNTKSVYPAMWEGNMELSVSEMTEHPNWYAFGDMILPSCDFAKEYDEDVLIYTAYVHNLSRMSWNLLKKSKYASMSREKIIGEILNDDLKLSPLVQDRIESFKKDHFTYPIAGVHVRFTDLLVGLSNRAYHKQIKKILKKEPDLSVFLATDNKNVVKEFKKHYKNVVVLDKWLPKHAGEPVHYYCAKDDRFQMGIDALADMYLMGMCDYLIYNGYSTFTFVTRRLPWIPRKNKFCLRPGGLVFKIFREFRWKLIEIKQCTCRVFLKRNTLFRKPIRNHSIIYFLRRLMEELRTDHSEESDES